jgi:HYDIN/CFA65/VesB family protein
MKRVVTLALLAFGLAAFTPGQDVSKTSQGKDGKQISLQATASPASLDFGDQVVQTIGKPLRVTLTNNTDQPIRISGIDIAEEGEDFVIDTNYGNDDCTAGTIGAGKSCNIRVAFFPLLVGQRTSFLLIAYDDANQPQKISLKGNGIKPSSEAVPRSLIR